MGKRRDTEEPCPFLGRSFYSVAREEFDIRVTEKKREGENKKEEGLKKMWESRGVAEAVI